jgi:uncharacterized protein YdaU (DUF1376 family)
MLGIERKRNEDMQRSEAVPHFRSEEDMSAEKSPDGYTPDRSERSEQTRPREMLSMGNSYGNVAVAANRNKEMTFTVSENRRHNSATLDNGHKRLDGERRRSAADLFGQAFTNRYDPTNGAFAYKTGKLQPEKRVVDRIKKYVEEKGQNTVETILPFFTMDRDKKRLKELEAETRRVKEQGQDAQELEHEKVQLSRAISQKEQMQARFIRKMRLAIIKARVIADEDRTERRTSANLSDGMDSPDAPPEDEGDILGDRLLDAVRGKKPKL